MTPGDPPDDTSNAVTPDELELTEREEVEPLDDNGRYVVSADGAPDISDADPDPDPPASNSAEDTLSESMVEEWLDTHLRQSQTTIGHHLALRTGTEVGHHTMHADQIATDFQNLLFWYATRVDPNTPAETVLGILLCESSLSPRFPTSQLEQYLINNGFTTDDTIGDLLTHLRQEDGLVFPP